MTDEQNAANNPSGTGEQGGGSKSTGDGRKSFYERIGANMPPGDLYVTSGGITITVTFLIVLTLALLYLIIVQWPVCELPEENQNANLATTSAGANRNAPPPANANLSATPGATANSNSNANINTNVGVTTNANAVVRVPSPSPTPTSSPNVAKLDADSIEPKSGSITGKTLVTINGKNFGSTPKDIVVKFGEAEAKISKVSDKSIFVTTPMHSEGIVDVTVEKGGDSDVLSSAYTYICPAPTGTSLFLMLVMAGALGGCIHAMRSFFWYVGQRELKWSWLPMYFTLPFIGAAMAMIFSLLIFAGFVDNTTGRSQSLFIIAVAGLVGMFSQQAALKLTDVANAFFTKPGQGSDAKPQKSLSVGEAETAKPFPLTVTAIDKSEGKATGGDEVTITGEGFSTSTTVEFGGVVGRVKTVSPTSITVVTPSHTAGEVEVEVKSDNQSVKVPKKFKYV